MVSALVGLRRKLEEFLAEMPELYPSDFHKVQKVAAVRTSSTEVRVSI